MNNIQDRIIGVYNNDGPGFHINVIQRKGYKKILDKINTIIPKSSVVGMLLEHSEEYKVVGSCETGIMQHNAFSWEVKGKSFVYENGLTKESLNLNKILRSWLNRLSMEQRAEFVDAMFYIIMSTGAKTVSELSKGKLLTANSMIPISTQSCKGLRKTVALVKGVDAEVGSNYVGIGLVEQNKICSTVAFAESYLYYNMIGKPYG